jgi:16S rRNA processing protein RimM
MNDKNRRICIAKIATAHGVRGLVKITCYAEDQNLLTSGTLYKGENSTETIKLSLQNKSGKYWIGKVEGIADRNEAELLRGTSLWIDRDALPEPEDDEFYIEDLIGLPVIDTDGNAIGEILAIQNFGAGDLLEIKPAEGHSFYHPFTKEATPHVSLEQITITPPQMGIDEKDEGENGEDTENNQQSETK